jgi:DNA-binding LytR/AlgR family response regulator
LKITLEESDIDEVEIIIKYKEMNNDIEKLISTVQLNSKTIVGKSEGKTYLLRMNDILYIDTADDKVFIYTKDSIYETNQRLYEIEEKLADTDTIRVNKSTILNLMKVDHVIPLVNGRIKAILINGETIIISRQYVHIFKTKIGM